MNKVDISYASKTEHNFAQRILIKTIEQIHEETEVYNIEVRQAKTYFAENYLVHHFCETCSGLAGRI